MFDEGMEVAESRIRVPKTSEVVADRIRAQIIRGELAEGGFLPPEGPLMETLGVSRPTLREAFRILEAEGLISVVRGSRTGAKVHRPSVDLVSRYTGYVLESRGTTIADLYQARLAIEPTVVRWLATVKGEMPGVARVREILKQLEDFVRDDRHDDFIDAVELFHHSLVTATDNKTLSLVSRLLLNLARTHQNAVQRRHPRDRMSRSKSIRVGLRSYQKLLALIDAGEVEEAVAHWRLHLRNANDTWTAAGEGERIVDSLGNEV